MQNNQGGGSLRLIALTEILIILDITRTESNSILIIHYTKKNGGYVFVLH